MEESTSRRPRALLAVVAAVLMTLSMSAPAFAARDIPVGGANVNDQNLANANYRLAIRFVLDRDTSLYRFVSGFKAEGANWWPEGSTCSGTGSGCYGAGNGGTISAQLVTVKPDGTPDLSNVLASETFSPETRYAESIAAAGIPGGAINLLWYVNTGGVRLNGDTMYAMVYRNVGADPAHNFSSVNSPVMKESSAGPNGRNNLDPNAPGAVAGLDPREAVAWSEDAGATWSWGRKVGPYYGEADGDDGTRLPWYGYQSAPGAAYTPVQPYYNYWDDCSNCTLRLSGAPQAVTLTRAGGYAPDGESVGIVTVRNLRTGQTGVTVPLGDGVAVGALVPPVAIAAGDTYTVHVSGTVYQNPADQMIRSTFGIGGLGTPFPFTTNGSPKRAEAFALPHPWFTAALNGGSGMTSGPGSGAGAGSGADDGSSSSSGPNPGGVGRYATLIQATRGLLGYWRFGETGGRVAVASAGGPNGTYGKGTRLRRQGLVSGDGDTALVNTRKSSGSRVSLGDGFNFAGTASFSLEAWVAPAALDRKSRRIFDRFFTRHGRTQEYYLMATNRRLSFARVRGQHYDTATMTSPLKIGRRYHLVVTYNRRTLRLYVNGKLAADGRSRQGLAKGKAALTVGAKTGGGYNFSGTIDDVAVYGTALSAATVRSHYDAGTGA